MLNGTPHTILTFIANAVLLSVLVAASVSVVLFVINVPARVARRGLEKYLATSRRRHYYQLGLNPTAGRIRRQVRREANELIASVARPPTELPSAGLPRRFYVDPWPFVNDQTLNQNLASICPDLDLKGELERPTMCADLEKLGPMVRNRLVFVVRAVTFVAALLVAGSWQFNSFDVLQGLGSSQALLRLPAFWETGFAYYVGDGVIGWSNIAGVLISSIVLSLISVAPIWALFMRGDGRLNATAPSQDPGAVQSSDPSDERASLGRDKCTVRTLNFAGGAFDSIMQIGVAHALLVIQGRAPDAVVGVSVGAVNAAAIAEILQAGEEQEREVLRDYFADKAPGEINRDTVGGLWAQLPPKEQQQLQRLRLRARVETLRRCIEAAQRAPEELFDALLPDPYQIESLNPLHPLEQPRFAKKERAERAKATTSQTGLVRLYNDLLNIPFSIGTITRVIRRYLGIKAAGDIQDFGTRWAVRINEAFRLWVLLGINLFYAAPVIRFLLRAFRKAPDTRTATAGNLIFRFRPLKKLKGFIKNVLIFLFLLLFWVGLTLAPFSFGHLLALIFPIPESIRILITVSVYILALLPWVMSGKRLSQAERSTAVDAVIGGASTLLMLLLLALGWTTFLFALGWAIFQLVLAIPPIWLFDLTNMATAIDGWKSGGWQGNGRVVVLVLLLPILVVGLFIVNAFSHPHSFIDRLLRSYHLHDAFLRVHGLRMFLVNVFDPTFYDRSGMDQIVEDSLNDQLQQTPPPKDSEKKGPKQIGYYSSTQRLEPILVGAAVANTSTGKLDVVARKTPVVDALIAAVAVTPLFPAVELDDNLYIDGSNVANEPTRALLRYLRPRLNRDSGTVHIYSVSPFPLSHAKLGRVLDSTLSSDEGNEKADGDEKDDKQPDAYLNLINVALRALRLQRFRDATLERRLTELITRAIREGDDHVRIPDPKDPDNPEKDEWYFRAWVTPIELDFALNNNIRVIGSDKEKRRRQIYETIADGCRASLQVMMGDAIREVADRANEEGTGCVAEIEDGTKEWIAPCTLAVAAHMKSRKRASALADVTLMGRDAKIGPGLVEICRHCKIWRHDLKELTPDSGLQRKLGRYNKAHLRQTALWEKRGPAWPHEREYGDEIDVGEKSLENAETDPHFVRKDTPRKIKTVEALKKLAAVVEAERASGKTESSVGSAIWPRERKSLVGTKQESPPARLAGNERTTISFLFSGGVFRGVYQMGVLTALDQLNLKPDVIAGASVGAITAAMVAETFSIDDRDLRQLRIARLAAVYLAIDRIILTDRFADFIRDLTLRAADTHFSVRRADRFFRKYDHPSLLEFDRNARSVIAGLERLLYVNPWQLNEFIRDFRNREHGKTLERLRDFGQQVLDRMFVGDQVLGADALEDLIQEYVVGSDSADGAGLKFDDLRRRAGIQFLATATNLPDGELEILGESPYLRDERDRSPLLSEGLLASSAFPGVFRPRWSWELFPGTSSYAQYIDGGVMDNLPIDAITQFLYRASIAGLISRQPADGPHLVVAASLQVKAQRYALASTRREFRESWITLRRRAKELQYNTKIDIYQQTEEALRKLDEHYRKLDSENPSYEKEKGEKGGFKLLNLEVVTVKPDRLCGTFAFHPMLGFRRQSQKESIAHGCASTLLRFGEIKSDSEKRDYLRGWRVDEDKVPDKHKWADAFDKVANDIDKIRDEGRCWLTGRPCPFSRQHLKALVDRIPDDVKVRETLHDKTQDEVADIHELCLRKKTHLRTI